MTKTTEPRDTAQRPAHDGWVVLIDDSAPAPLARVGDAAEQLHAAMLADTVDAACDAAQVSRVVVVTNAVLTVTHPKLAVVSAADVEVPSDRTVALPAHLPALSSDELDDYLLAGAPETPVARTLQLRVTSARDLAAIANEPTLGARTRRLASAWQPRDPGPIDPKRRYRIDEND